MEALKRKYKCTLSDRQAMVFFDKEKPTYRGYTEHLNYLLQVNAAAGGHFDRNVLMSIVHRCGTDLIHEISSKYDLSRTDYIEHATELVEFADELRNERNINKGTGRPNRVGSVVNAAEPKRPEKRECYNCGREGHISVDCRDAKKKSFDFGKKYEKQEKKEDAKDTFALNVCNLGEDQNSTHDVRPQKFEWILHSG
jgi:hypothetical protein